MICKFAIKKGSITTAQAAVLLGVGQRGARKILAQMVEKKFLKREGASRSTVYVIDM